LNFETSQAETYSATTNEIINKWGFAVYLKEIYVKLNLYMKGCVK